MAKKRYKLKKQVYYFLIGIVAIIILGIAGTNIYKNYQYKKTYEYKLLQLNYTEDEVKLLEDNLTDKELNKLSEKEKKDNNIISLMKCKFFKKANLDRYIALIGNQKKVDYDEIVNTVNINHDYDYYGIDLTTDTSEDIKMIVNKYYLLSSDYEPDDLVEIASTYAWGDTKTIRKEVYNAFINMHNAAKEDGFYLMINSAYRSYADQKEVYDSYADTYGSDYADSIAARPGASEHQTGLALDIFEKENSSSKTFVNTEAYIWLKENSYKYGFILRYAENTVDITGYSFESWHYRYVGKETAKKVHDLGITYDEYYANYLH